MPIAADEKTYAVVSSAANKRLVTVIEATRARVVQFPKIQTEAIEPDEESAELLTEAVNFDWLIFFDVLAVDYFLRKFEETETDFFALDAVRICAVGEAVADRLRFARLHADVIPPQVESAAVLAALSDYIGEAQMAEKRFLLVKKLSAADEIKNKLTKKAAQAAQLNIYRTRIEESPENARLKALLKGGAIDEFVFSSPEDLIALQEFLAAESIAEMLTDATISAADEVTFQSLREHNLQPRRFSTK